MRYAAAAVVLCAACDVRELHLCDLATAPPDLAGSGLVHGQVNTVAEVCYFNQPEIPCVMTDTSGKFSITDGPTSGDWALVYTAPGFLGRVLPYHGRLDL